MNNCRESWGQESEDVRWKEAERIRSGEEEQKGGGSRTLGIIHDYVINEVVVCTICDSFVAEVGR